MTRARKTYARKARRYRKDADHLTRWIEETIEASPGLKELARQADDWAERFRAENGPIEERVLLPLMATGTDARYAMVSASSFAEVDAAYAAWERYVGACNKHGFVAVPL